MFLWCCCSVIMSLNQRSSVNTNKKVAAERKKRGTGDGGRRRICWGLTCLAKLDTSYCRKPCWWSVVRACWYVSAVTSSACTLASPPWTRLKSCVPRSSVSWYRDTWSSHTFSSSDSSLSQDSTLCSGRPNITSTDTLPGRSLLASSMVCSAWWELWSLPRIFKSSSCRDWGMKKNLCQHCHKNIINVYYFQL